MSSSDADAAQVQSAASLARQSGLEPIAVPSLQALSAHPAFAGSTRALVIAIDPRSDARAAEEAVRFVEREGGRAFVLYVSDSIPPAIYKALLRTRSGEWASFESLAAELHEVLKRLGSPETSGAGARIVCCHPSKGGVGNTMLAVELAVAFAADPRQATRVALLDLNLGGGSLADSLDLEPRFALQEVIDHPERLDDQLLDVFASRFSNRLDVYAMPSSGDYRADVAPQIVFAMIDLLAKRYDLVLIDLPNRYFVWTNNLLSGADAIVVSGTGTVPALKQMTAKLAGMTDSRIDPNKIAVVVNQCETTFFGQFVRRAEIGRALQDWRVFLVRDDAATFRGSANVGRPVLDVAPTAAAAKDIKKLTDWIRSTTDIAVAAGTAVKP